MPHSQQLQDSSSGVFRVTSPANNNNSIANHRHSLTFSQMDGILSSFRCPRDCHLFEESYRQLIDCPFGHLNIGEQQQQLKKVPPVACVASLLGDCEKVVKTEVIALKASSDNNNNYNRDLSINHCPDGIHFSALQLIDLEHFYEQIASAKMVQLNAVPMEVVVEPGPSNSNPAPVQASQPSAGDGDCPICMAQMTGKTLGMLSKCKHVFCFDCILEWFSKVPSSPGRLQTCPVCRATSSFVLPWSQVITGRAEKRAIFDMQHMALHGINAQLAPLEDFDGEETTEYEEAEDEEAEDEGAEDEEDEDSEEGGYSSEDDEDRDEDENSSEV